MINGGGGGGNYLPPERVISPNALQHQNSAPFGVGVGTGGGGGGGVGGRKAFMEMTSMAPLKEQQHQNPSAPPPPPVQNHLSSIAPPILNRRGSCQQVVGAIVQRPSDEGLIKV